MTGGVIESRISAHASIEDSIKYTEWKCGDMSATQTYMASKSLDIEKKDFTS